MPNYRVVEAHSSPDNDAPGLTNLEEAIKLAGKLKREHPAKEFVVEKVERVWPKSPAKPRSNAIHASIHLSNSDIGDE